MNAKTKPHDLLPHRKPMLLLDEICQLVPGRRCVARARIEHDLSWCATGTAALALACEAIAQAGGAAVFAVPEYENARPLLATIDTARLRFRGTASSELIVECDVERITRNLFSAEGAVLADGKCLVDARLALWLTPPAG